MIRFISILIIILFIPNLSSAKSDFFQAGIDLYNKKNLMMQNLNLNKI